mgnify:CR=1 FL=1
MSTFHERALKHAVQTNLSVLAQPLQEVLSNHEKGKYPSWLCDFVTQKRAPWDLYDAYVLLAIYARWRLGELVFAHVELGEVPEADAEVEANQRLLKKLPPPFSAVVDRSADGDGILTWSEALSEFSEDSGEQANTPLEIGSTKSSRTLWHIERSQRLARWPYGSSVLVVTYRTKKFESWFGDSKEALRTR